MKEHTFEDYFRETLTRSSCVDHQLRCNITEDGVTFYIHPTVDGRTPTFVVKGNTLKCVGDSCDGK